MVLLVSLPCVHPPEAETYTLYTFLQLDDATKSGGLFLGPPGFHFIKFPSTFITVDVNNRKCVSNDGLLVEFSVTFQVRTGYFFVHCHVHTRKLNHIPFTSISLRKYQMTTANVLPAIVMYRDFHKWASIVEQAGKCMRASLDFHSSFIK